MAKRNKMIYKELKKMDKLIMKEHKIACRCKGDERLMHWSAAEMYEARKAELIGMIEN